MRFTFRRNRFSFYQPRRELDEVMGTASRYAGPGGIDSLDFLMAALDTKKGAALVRKLDVDLTHLEASAGQARPIREPIPGLTDDAKAVIEAYTHRTLTARKDPGIEELLLGLAGARCRAQAVLAGHGITADRVVGLIGGPPAA